MKKATAVASSNIAFIKFLGKTDEKLRLPTNTSISMCLSNTFTTTTVEFSPKYKKDSVEIKGEKFKENEEKRIIDHLKRIRKLAKLNLYAKIVTQNNFPKSSGIASSASGFAALTLAGSKGAGLNLTEKQLTILARLASGSACRSVPSGFVEWKKAKTSDESYAYSLYPPDYWNILDILVIVDQGTKSISTTDAHILAATSPFFPQRLKNLPAKIIQLKRALKTKNFILFGEIIESEALNMHSVMMTTIPPLFYWSDKTVEVMQAIWSGRKKGLSVYFTIDAGPNVHLICGAENKDKVISFIKEIKGVKQIIINKPGRGARLIEEHLWI